MLRIFKKVTIYFSIILLVLMFLLFVLNAMNFRPVMGLVNYSVTTLLSRDFQARGFSIGFNRDYGLTAYIHKVKLSNPEWAGDRPMVTLDDASVSVALSKLITGTVDVTNVVAENAVIDIIDKPGKQKNYLFFSSDQQQPVEQKDQTDDSPGKIFIPQVTLHNIVIIYESQDVRSDVKIQQATIQNQRIDNNQLNMMVTINGIPYIVNGDFGNVNNLFTNHGLDTSVVIDSENNHLNAKLNMNLGEAKPSVVGDIIVDIDDIPALMKTTNAKSIPAWSRKLNSLHVASNILYNKGAVKKGVIHGKADYRNQHVTFDAKAHSLKDQLYPINIESAMQANEHDLLKLQGTLDRPYSKTQWLTVDLKGHLNNLDYVTNKPIKLADIDISSHVMAMDNELKIKPLSIKADFNDHPLESTLWVDSDITPGQPIDSRLTLNSTYMDQNIVNAKGDIRLPISGDDWLSMTVKGGVKDLSQDLKALDIQLPYKISKFEYIAKLEGVSSEQINIAIDPLNANINKQPVYGQFYVETDLNDYKTNLKTYLLINEDQDSHVRLDGFIGPPDANEQWMDLTLSSDIHQGDDLSFLDQENEKYFSEIGRIESKMSAKAQDGKIQLIIDPSTLYLGEDVVDYKGQFLYGLYHDDSPLDIHLEAENNKQDHLIVSGDGKLGSHQTFKLKSQLDIHDLASYNKYLPHVVNITNNTDLSIKDNELQLSTFKLSAESNQNQLTLSAQALVDLTNHTIDKAHLKSDLADIHLQSEMSGQYQPLNLSGNLALQANDLSAANRFIDGWGIGYVPIINKLDFHSNYQLNNDQGKLNLAYQGSGTDVKGEFTYKQHHDRLDYTADINSSQIDVVSFQSAIDQAKSNHDVYQSKNDLRNKRQIIKDAGQLDQDPEEVKEKAKQALQQKAEVPHWMEVPIDPYVDYYDLNAKVTIDRIIFKADTAKNIHILMNNSVDDHTGKLSIQADQLFGGKINSTTTRKKIDEFHHLKTDTYVGVINLGQMGQSISALDQLKHGELMLNIYGETEGQTVNDFIRLLNGRVKVGVNELKQSLANPKGSIGKFLLLLAGGDWKTGISMKCAIGQFNITKGVYNIDNLMLDTTGAVVTGTGEIDLPNQTVDIVLEPNAKYVNLSSLSTAFRITGNFRNIYFFPDALSTAKSAGLIAGTVALSATGIGLIAVGAVAAGKLGQGVYYANKDFCSGVLEPLSEKEIQKIQQHNQNMLDDLVTQGTIGVKGLSEGYSKSVDFSKTMLESSGKSIGTGVQSVGDTSGQLFNNAVNPAVDKSKEIYNKSLDFLSDE